MKAITFLGTNPLTTNYRMPGGQEWVAPFFGAALPHFYPDLQLRVFVTREARQKCYIDLETLVLPHVNDLEAVDITDGRTEDELWQIFEAVIEVVGDGEHVIFDITHGFRSLPFLSFLAAAYLRVIKNIRLEAVLYANFEARDRTVEPNRAPVIDLTPFVSLLDWMVAGDRFIRFGDAHDLAERIRQAKPAWPDQQRDADARNTALLLAKAATALDTVSSALRLIRPAEAMVASELLQTHLVDATQGIERHARPFQPLSQRVAAEYAPLALNQQAMDHDLIAVLARERAMVHWYLKRRQYVQTMAVAREWIVTWIMAHVGMTDQFDARSRERVERSLGRLIQSRKGMQPEDTHTSLDLSGLRQVDQAVNLYAELGDARNDLLHAGKRRHPSTAKSLDRTYAVGGEQVKE